MGQQGGSSGPGQSANLPIIPGDALWQGLLITEELNQACETSIHAVKFC
jgi:hypothetical protein